jgi:hypothetical protein
MVIGDSVRIWAGERRLLPMGEANQSYRVRCLARAGYLRLMSGIKRKVLLAGNEVLIESGEIATLTGRETMQIEFIGLKN